MENYIVIARINKVDYMVNLKAESLLEAEHRILDCGICGTHEYGVESAMAFDVESAKTETFRAMAFTSECISYDGIIEKIQQSNDRIRKLDEAEKESKRLLKMIAELESQKAEAEAKLKEYQKVMKG